MRPGRAVRATLLELVLFLGPAIAVALAGTVFAHREARSRAISIREPILGVLGAILRWGLILCGVLAATVIALKVAAANDQAPLALLAAPWAFALGGVIGLWRWASTRAAHARSGSEPGGGE
jgi:hypothetical protein